MLFNAIQMPDVIEPFPARGQTAVNVHEAARLSE
jgi:hypothetical protein